MKKIIARTLSSESRFPDTILLLLRFLVGITMMTHGVAKLLSFGELSATFPDPIGLGSSLSLLMIIGAEVGCSVLLILGAFTRLATLPLIFSMLVVIFVVHGSDPFQVKELPLLYFGIYVVLFFTGGGRYALDTLISKHWNVNIRDTSD